MRGRGETFRARRSSNWPPAPRIQLYCCDMLRAVITGFGVASPNGIGKTAFCRAILQGSSGVRRITRFDASDLPVQIAGDVNGFDELAWVDAHERKHMSRCVPLALAASHEALADAGLDPQRMP